MYTGKVIDFHLHIGKIEDWHPWVIQYFKEVNPDLFQNFETLMKPDRLEEYLAGEGVTYAVVLAENSPKVTGVVKNSYVHDFCKGHNNTSPFIPVSSVWVRHL